MKYNIFIQYAYIKQYIKIYSCYLEISKKITCDLEITCKKKKCPLWSKIIYYLLYFILALHVSICKQSQCMYLRHSVSSLDWNHWTSGPDCETLFWHLWPSMQITHFSTLFFSTVTLEQLFVSWVCLLFLSHHHNVSYDLLWSRTGSCWDRDPPMCPLGL